MTSKYLWAKPDTSTTVFSGSYENRLKLAEKSELLCFTAEETIKKDICLLFACYSSVKFILTPIVLNNLISPNDSVKEWFNSKSDEDNEKSFGFNGFSEFSNCLKLTTLEPMVLFLYSYLASLKRKAEYTVENSPKAVTEYLDKNKLHYCFNTLTRAGLLDEISSGKWRHAEEDKSKLLKSSMQKAVSIAEFIYSCELMTANIKRQIDMCQNFNTKDFIIVAERTVKQEFCCCPVCRNLPDGKNIIPVDYEILKPFHYNCGTMFLSGKREWFSDYFVF